MLFFVVDLELDSVNDIFEHVEDGLFGLLAAAFLLDEELVELGELLVHFAGDVGVHFLALGDFGLDALVEAGKVGLEALVEALDVLVSGAAFGAELGADEAGLFLDEADNLLLSVPARLE